MDYLSLFKMPKPMKITGRSSSITNAFVNAIIPVIAPTNDQVKEALIILGMDKDSIECAYCGANVTEWDHLRPLVLNKKPTGYISEIHNLVPSCGKCNQSKGNKNWQVWMYSDAKLSPKSRKIKDLNIRKSRLVEYEKWGEPIKVDFEKTVGKNIWEEHWTNWKKILDQMELAQNHAKKINTLLINAYLKNKNQIPK